jgi:flagellar protein FliS
MSYSQANVYREREVLTASPEKLVVMTYDHVLVNLHRASEAIEANSIERRVAALSKAREGVMELLAATDERGGQLAANLRSVYAFLLREILALGRSRDLAKLKEVVAIVSNLREAFASVANDPTLLHSPAA